MCHNDTWRVITMHRRVMWHVQQCHWDIVRNSKSWHWSGLQRLNIVSCTRLKCWSACIIRWLSFSSLSPTICKFHTILLDKHKDINIITVEHYVSNYDMLSSFHLIQIIVHLIISEKYLNNSWNQPPCNPCKSNLITSLKASI